MDVYFFCCVCVFIDGRNRLTASLLGPIQLIATPQKLSRNTMSDHCMHIAPVTAIHFVRALCLDVMQSERGPIRAIYLSLYGSKERPRRKIAALDPIDGAAGLRLAGAQVDRDRD